MVFDEEKYWKIEDYFDDWFKGESWKKFEQEMQVDDELSKEVELYKDMEEFLFDFFENVFCKNLSCLVGEVIVEFKKGLGKWIFVLFVLILLVLVWWFFLGDNVF